MTRVYVDGQEGTPAADAAMFWQPATTSTCSASPCQAQGPRRPGTPAQRRDVAFLCLPDTAAREAVALIENPHTCIIDASTAHRTAPNWVFGLPELAPDQRARIKQSKRIANPGCHATSFLLLVRPLVTAGLVPATFPLTATSITGYSGGGRRCRTV